MKSIIFTIVLWLYLLKIVSASKSNPLEGINKLMTSKDPVRLVNLQRVSPFRTSKNDTSISYKINKNPEPRTSPLLFKQSLGLIPGQPFVFNLDKWRRLQSCGLFKDLTAKGRTDPKSGDVYLEVSGKELPSLKITPEIAVGASLESPEATGGISLEDINFMGMGQNLEVMVAKKEGQQIGVAELPAGIKIKWKDSNVYQESKVSAGYDEDHLFVDALDQTPLRSRGIVGTSSIDNTAAQVQTAVKRSFISFTDRFQIKLPSFSSSSSTTTSIEESNKDNILGSLIVKLEPYRSKLKSELWTGTAGTTKKSKRNKNPKALDGDGLYLYGAELTSSLILKDSSSIGIEYDHGISGLFNSPSTRDKYSSLKLNMKKPLDYIGSVDLTYPTWLTRPWSLLPFFSYRKDGTDISTELTSSNINVSGTIKVNCGTANGDGRIPYLHQTDLGDSRILRGYESDSLAERRVSSYGAVKSDIYLDGLSPTGMLGFFIDTALFNTESLTKNNKKNKKLENNDEYIAKNKHSTIGFSFRFAGLRADVGWPYDLSTPPRLYLNVDDT